MKRRKQYLEPEGGDKLPRTTYYNHLRKNKAKNINESRTNVEITSANAESENVVSASDRTANQDKEVTSKKARLTKETTQEIEKETPVSEVLNNDKLPTTEEGHLRSQDNGIQNNQHEPFQQNISSGSDAPKTSSEREENCSDSWTAAFTQKISCNIDITKGELVTLLLNFTIRHKLTDSGMLDLVELINTISSKEVLPPSLYKIRKLNTFADNIVSKHFYCSECFSYVTPTTAGNTTEKCENCSNNVNVSNAQLDNCFLMVSMKDQIKNLLDDNDGSIEQILSIDKNESRADVMKDITDGYMYKQLQKQNNYLPMLTYNFCIDGLALFNNAKGSVWPILFTINEFPIKERCKHVLLAGLWFGKHEPKMEVFLKPFTDQAILLTKEGIDINFRGKSINFKVFPACCIADSVARPTIQNSVQFNGFYGCSWCKHPGFTVNGTVKYPLRNAVYEDRTEKETLNHMEQAFETGRSVHGIKGPSALLVLPNFNIIHSFVPDYLHCVFLGVVKQFINMLFDSSNNGKEFYVGRPTIVKVVDERMREVKMPNDVGRIPRSIRERNLYKASEWRNFLLYMCIPCLENILPEPYLKHISLLVNAMFIFLQREISIEEIREAENYLFQFVSEAEYLYEEKVMTFNVHCLLHLGRSVLDWGPIWTHSMFVFEGYNSVLQKYSRGSTGIRTQIVRRYLERSFYSSPTVLNNCSTNVKVYLTGIQKHKHKFLTEVGDIKLFGVGISRQLKKAESDALDAIGLSSQHILFYKKMIKHNIVYQSYDTKKQSRYCNSVVHTNNSKYGFIKSICLFTELQKIAVFFSEYILVEDTSDFPNKNFAYSSGNARDITLLETEAIVGCCTVYEHENKIVFSKTVNNFETCT